VQNCDKSRKYFREFKTVHLLTLGQLVNFLFYATFIEQVKEIHQLNFRANTKQGSQEF